MKHKSLMGLLLSGALVFSAAQAQDTVTVAAGAVGQELQLTIEAAERYMELNPGVTVNVLDTPDMADDRLGLYLQFFQAQSSEVDVYQIDVIWPGDLAEHFVDLYEYGAADVVDQHFPAIIENNTVDGELIGIPWFTDAGLLYYRTDLLEKYGYDGPPTTWAELDEMATTVMEGERAEGNSDFWGYVYQGNAYEGLTTNALEWIASANGGTIISPDGEITINNPNAVDIIDHIASMVGRISPTGVLGFDEEGARNAFESGNALFMRNWPYAYSLGHDAATSAVAGLFDVTPVPGTADGQPAATLGGWQLAVSNYSDNPALAADVALYLASYDEQKIRAVEGSLNPTIAALYDDEDVLEAVPFFGSLYDVFINAVARPSTATAPQYAAVSQLFYRAVHTVLSGDEDAGTALTLLELDLMDLTGFDVGAP